MKSLSEKKPIIPDVNLAEGQTINNADLMTTKVSVCEVKIRFNKLNLIQLCWVF
jgi:hypothetical protein